MDPRYPKVFRCHPPGDASCLLIVPVVGQCGMPMVDDAESDSAANDQNDPATECECSSDQPHNSNPNPANAAALLRHEEAATSAAGALDADSNCSEATAE